MGNLRFRVALLVGKLTGFLLRKLTGRGSNTPGVIMQKLCPDSLARFQMPKLVICVTGTNGKTSTSNLITHLLRHAGMTVTNNSAGSNMAPGLITALAQDATLGGKVRTDAAVLEVDERSSPYIYPKMVPDYLLCTNLFRDSIKRNGHSEFIFHKINDVLPKKTVLLLNGNDPISGRLGEGTNERVLFSVARTAESTETCPNRVCDAGSCPVCHRPLHYDFYHYHHIGEPRCTCGFSMPASRFWAQDVDMAAGTFVFSEETGERTTLPLDGDTLFCVFNKTAAAAMCRLVGLTAEEIRDGMAGFTNAKSRFEETCHGNRRVVTMLCKNQNPVSSSQSFAYVNRVTGTKDVVLVITDSKDAVHGHEDISWLYDTDFEQLKDPDIHKILIGGSRCYDVALRLVLAGVSEERLALFTDYDVLCREAPALVAEEGTTVVYFELYALPIAQRVRKALMAEEADG